MDPSPPTDILDPELDRLAREMRLQSALHARYLRDLIADGFTLEQAFTLVRDHHAVFVWTTLQPDEDLPPWLVAATSSGSSPSTGSVLPFSKPESSEQ